MCPRCLVLHLWAAPWAPAAAPRIPLRAPWWTCRAWRGHAVAGILKNLPVQWWLGNLRTEAQLRIFEGECHPDRVGTLVKYFWGCQRCCRPMRQGFWRPCPLRLDLSCRQSWDLLCLARSVFAMDVGDKNTWDHLWGVSYVSYWGHEINDFKRWMIFISWWVARTCMQEWSW